ncbi:MAG TPA: fimbrial protein FimV, partial [Xanthomonadaceae bacterium]|nr:fimbrial protein FimV [Xanthomonadaceae bacterium]
MNRTLRLPLALALALGSSHALALGLGQVEVKSALYQPLVVEIPVTTTRPSETENLKVRLASPEAFARVGLDRPPSLAANLEFSLERRGSTAPVIRITTPTRVNDPFLSFLLEVDWGEGKLLREVTILLDPPGMQPAQRV